MTDTIITEFLRRRTIISDFQLIEHIFHSKNTYENLPEVKYSVKLSDDQLRTLLDSWKSTVHHFASFLEKNARSILAKTDGKTLYEFDTKDKMAYQAALISEIFRYPGISKNSSRLDIKTLHQKILTLLSSNAEIFEFRIAWGQAKQTCGQLKTSGSMADLAEIFAVLQLSVILQATKNIIGHQKKVRLLVQTGASRFAMAFYPDIQANEQYDSQRQMMADYFNEPNEILFKPYSHHQTKEQASQRFQRFKKNCDLVKTQHIAKIFNHVLLSINWHQVLSEQTPFYNLNMDFEKALRLVIVCIIRGNNPKKFFDPSNPNYKQMIQFYNRVNTISYDSAKKYIALQYTNAEYDIDQIKDEPYLRLTVHEKTDHPDIPAIFTLGKLGGNFLSQNISIYLTKEGKIRFKSYVEILDEYQVKAIFAEPSCRLYPLSWLTHQQAICYIDRESPDESVIELLKNGFKIWLGDILEI